MGSQSVSSNRAQAIEIFVTERAFETYQFMDGSNVVKKMTFILVLLGALDTVELC